MERADVERNTILLGLAGSHSYGIATPASDVDYRGVFISPLSYYLGFNRIEQKDSGWDVEEGSGLFPDLDGVKDTNVYELRKYLSLLVKNHPNSLELLWQNKSHILHSSKEGDTLRLCKRDFLSKDIGRSMVGYSYSQIGRAKRHRRWLLDPPKRKPRLADFGLSEEFKPLDKSDRNAFLSYLHILTKDCLEYIDDLDEIVEIYKHRIDLAGVISHNDFSDEALSFIRPFTRSTKDFISLLHATQRYRAAMKEWDDYQDWKANRNPKRAALEAKCGYDSKHISQAIRLLKVCKEVLTTHELIVDRREAGDAEELINIKLGNVDYDTVLQQAEDLYQSIKPLYDTSTLRDKVDREWANDMCCHLVSRYYGINYS